MYETTRVNVGNLDFRAGSCAETKTIPVKLLFTHKKCDFGAISVTARSYAAPRIVIFSERLLCHSLAQYEQVFGDIGCSPFTKCSRKIRL